MHLLTPIAVFWPDFHLFNLVKVKYEKSRTGLNLCAGLLAESRTDTVLVKDYARIKESFREQEPASLHTAYNNASINTQTMDGASCDTE